MNVYLLEDCAKIYGHILMKFCGHIILEPNNNLLVLELRDYPYLDVMMMIFDTQSCSITYHECFMFTSKSPVSDFYTF